MSLAITRAISLFLNAGTGSAIVAAINGGIHENRALASCFRCLRDMSDDLYYGAGEGDHESIRLDVAYWEIAMTERAVSGTPEVDSLFAAHCAETQRVRESGDGFEIDDLADLAVEQVKQMAICDFTYHAGKMKTAREPLSLVYS